jgi:hypothetical protein
MWLALVLLGLFLCLLIVSICIGLWVGVGGGLFASTESGSADEPRPANSQPSGKDQPVDSAASLESSPAKTRPSLDQKPEGHGKPIPRVETLPSADIAESGFDHETANGSEETTRKEEGPSVSGGSFFGISAKGQRFVYVVDCSGSMSGAPFARARAELLSSLANLKESQEFFVILYASEGYPMFFPELSDGFLNATDESLKIVKTWLVDFTVDGGTNPGPAISQAIAMKPGAVFFLSDGVIPDSVVDEIRVANSHHIPIHAIGFIDRSGEAVLKKIAAENSGSYKFVP